MNPLVDTPPSPTPRKGRVGDPPDSDSSVRSFSSEVEAASGSARASATPRRLVVARASLGEVISQLLTQVSLGSLPSGSAEEITVVLEETQRLLCSSFPWVRVTEDRRQANCLLLPTAPQQVANSILAELEQVLVSREQLERALCAGSHILQHYVVYLVALGVARLVPDQLDAGQEDLQRMESAPRCLPPVAMVTVSSDLVDDLLVQLILRFHPLTGDDSGRQLDQQQLLTLILQLSVLTLETLRRMPTVAVVTGLPRPGWNVRRLTFLVQSRLMRGFGSALQLKKLMARGDPDLLRAIPGDVMEVLLAQHRSGIPESASVPTPAEEDPTEARLFSRPLPAPTGERLYQEFGTWVRRSKLFRRALSPPSDQEVREYRRGLTAPGFSTRAALWVRGEMLVWDDYDEVTTAGCGGDDDGDGGGAPAPNPLALGVTADALQRDFPLAHLCLSSQRGVRAQQAEADGARGAAGDAGGPSPAPPVGPLHPGALLLLRPDAPRGSGGRVRPALTTHKVLIRRSAVERVVAELFRGRDQAYVRSHIRRFRACERELVEQVHLLLVQQTSKYRDNKVFGRTVERLRTPEQQVRLALDLCRPLKERLSEALPSVWLTREGLMEEPQLALLACSLIATVVLHHLEPSVTFGEEVKAGDDTPYCVNIPVRREEAAEEEEEERPPTLLEERLRRERQASREEIPTASSVEMESTEVKKVKKRRWWFSRLRRLIPCMKTANNKMTT